MENLNRFVERVCVSDEIRSDPRAYIYNPRNNNDLRKTCFSKPRAPCEGGRHRRMPPPPGNLVGVLREKGRRCGSAVRLDPATAAAVMGGGAWIGDRRRARFPDLPTTWPGRPTPRPGRHLADAPDVLHRARMSSDPDQAANDPLVCSADSRPSSCARIAGRSPWACWACCSSPSCCCPSPCSRGGSWIGWSLIVRHRQPCPRPVAVDGARLDPRGAGHRPGSLAWRRSGCTDCGPCWRGGSRP